MGAAKDKHLHDFIPMRELGIRNLVGTHQRGLGMQVAVGQYTALGAGAETVSFGDDLGLQDMADTNYVVVCTADDGAIAAGITRTVDGFDTPAGVFALNDVIDVVVVGQIEGHPNP